MGIGVSDGTNYADMGEWVAHTSSGVPLEASQEPADALKSSGGAQTPAKVSTRELPDFTNQYGTPDDKKIWPERLVDSALQALKLPGDVYQGKVPLWQMDPVTGEMNTSTQAIERATDLAGLAVMGPAPVAAKMADGTLGSFMGVKSKIFDKNKLYTAQRLEQEGANPDEIWQQTGTFRGADQRWRQEIPDNNATLNPKAFDREITPASGGPDSQWSVGGTEATEIWSPKAKGAYATSIPGSKNMSLKEMYDWLTANAPPKSTPLDQVLNHPELFKAYPELRNIKVQQYLKKSDTDTTLGQAIGDEIHLSPGNPGFIKSVLLHEVQHHIQRLEGFARGGNQREFASPEFKTIQANFPKVEKEAYEEVAKNFPHIPREEIQDMALTIKSGMEYPDDKNLKQAVDLFKQDYPEAFLKVHNIVRTQHAIEQRQLQNGELYRRLQGEVEARNVQARKDFTDVQRLLKNPERTEDRPRFVQIGVGQDEAIQLK